MFNFRSNNVIELRNIITKSPRTQVQSLNDCIGLPRQNKVFWQERVLKLHSCKISMSCLVL